MIREPHAARRTPAFAGAAERDRANTERVGVRAMRHCREEGSSGGSLAGAMLGQ
jgi:hypothetical protein